MHSMLSSKRIDDLNVAVDLENGFRVGSWKVEPQRGAVSGRNGETCHLEPKVMSVLVCLASHSNELTPRNVLMNSVWPNQSVSDEPLTRAIGELRRALHDRSSDPKYIETIPKRGYRLIGEVTPLTGGAGDAPMRQFQLNSKTSIAIAIFVLAIAIVLLAYQLSQLDAPNGNSGTDHGQDAVRIEISYRDGL